MLDITPIFKLTSRTKDKNFKAKSASFYIDVSDLSFLMNQEVVIEHINVDTNEIRYVFVKGIKLYNSALPRKIKGGKNYCIYRY